MQTASTQSLKVLGYLSWREIWQQICEGTQALREFLGDVEGLTISEDFVRDRGVAPHI